MVRPSRRGGVPVLSRPTGSASSRSRAPSRLAGGSPALDGPEADASEEKRPV